MTTEFFGKIHDSNFIEFIL